MHSIYTLLKNIHMCTLCRFIPALQTPVKTQQLEENSDVQCSSYAAICCSHKGVGGGEGSGGVEYCAATTLLNSMFEHQLSFPPSSPYQGVTLLVFRFPSLVKTKRQQSAFCNIQLQYDSPIVVTCT